MAQQNGLAKTMKRRVFLKQTSFLKTRAAQRLSEPCNFFQMELSQFFDPIIC
jgi:hypothetical protein